MDNALEELTERFSDFNLSDLEEFEKEYQIKMNVAGGPELKPDIEEPSHRYETNKKKNKPFYEYHPPVKNTPWKKDYQLNNDHLMPISNAGTFLDLDCKIDPRKALVEWGMQMKLFFIFNGSKDDWNVETEEEKINILTDILIASFTGNVFNWWKGLSEDTQKLIKDSTKIALGRDKGLGIERIIEYIASEFLGEDWLQNTESEAKHDKLNARMKLINLTICNMCFVKEYTCEFSKYYYTQFMSHKDQNIYKNLYYSKLPYPWNGYFINEYEKYTNSSNNRLPDTLGARIRFLNIRLNEICIQRSLIKKSKNITKICCEKTEMPTQWGCYIPHKKRRKFHHEEKRYKKYNNFKRKYKKSGRKYYKRKFKNQKKTLDKSKCKCWNCGEIWHISTDCTKKKVRLLREDFEDIENDLEEITNLSDYEGKEVYMAEDSEYESG